MLPLVKAIRAALIGAALAVTVSRAGAVELSMRDTTFLALDTLRVGLDVDSIEESQNVLSYQLVLVFDSTVLAGVSGDAEGTITAPFGDPFTSGDLYPGEFRLAAAGIQPVSGSGRFVTLLLRSTSNLGGNTIIRFDTALLNEGDPPATYRDTLAVISVQPLSALEPGQLPAKPSFISVVPNPAHDSITLFLPPAVYPRQVTIWNTLGQRVAMFSTGGQRVELFLGNLPAGTYFATLDKQPESFTRFVLLK